MATINTVSTHDHPPASTTGVAAAHGLDDVLNQAVKNGELTVLDVELGRALVRWRNLQGDQANLVKIVAAQLSASLRRQQVCLPLETLLVTSALWRHWLAVNDAAGLATTLSDIGIVSDDSARSSPFVLAAGRLYLRSQFELEQRLAAAVRARIDSAKTVSTEVMKARLSLLYPRPPGSSGDALTPEPIHWQRVAAALALLRSLTVITGGPGTGKTSTVTALLALLAWQDEDRQSDLPAADGVQTRLRMGLAAPTGKAAARLAQAVSSAKARLLATDVPAKVIERIPDGAYTLHRLLGYRAEDQQFRYGATNPLPLDVLIVDEASMLDLRMSVAVFEALPADARLILLGDKDQLASVAAGSVLSDLCGGLVEHFEQSRFSVATAKHLAALTGYDFSTLQAKEVPNMADAVVWLRERFRFAGDSQVAKLADAIRAQDLAVLATSPCVAAADEFDIAAFAARRYQPLFELAEAGADAHELLKSAARFQLLCAVREGRWGVEWMNRQIQRLLAKDQVSALRPGTLVMATVNDYRLGVFNGDVGVVLKPLTLEADGGEQSTAQVAFTTERGLILVPVSRLMRYELAFAMTVHKAQGSEFDEVAVVVPPVPTVNEQSLLTRELIYTAVTRARENVRVFVAAQQLQNIVATQTQRLSGLAEQLWRVNSSENT